MRWTLALAVSAGSLTFAGCGGGGAHGTDAGGTQPAAALVQGTVVSRDGSTANLGGLFIRCPETGELAMTDGTGSFDLGAPAGRPFTLELSDPLLPPGMPSPGDCPESYDDSEDGSDIAGGMMQFDHRLDAGEVCQVEIVVEDGQIVQTWVGDPASAGDEAIGEAVLFGDGVMGEVEVFGGPGCAGAELEVNGFDGPHVLTVTLVDPSGAVETLGTLEVNADGEGHLAIDCCSGDPMPFGATTIDDLAGYGIEVLDETGAVVLEGEVPFVGAGHWDDWWMTFEDGTFGMPAGWMDAWMDAWMDPWSDAWMSGGMPMSGGMGMSSGMDMMTPGTGPGAGCTTTP